MKLKKYHDAFTLVELLVIIVIVAIIALIAVTSYGPFVLKGHRSDGINSILAAQLAEERYRSSNTQYGTLAQIGVSSTSPQGYYSLSVSGVSSTAFTITATGQNSQANDTEGSTACSTLTLAVSNGTVTQTPTACWPS